MRTGCLQLATRRVLYGERIIARTQSIIWLPLRDGDNEVLILIVDGFGGWGLTGRLEPADGGVLVPPT